jgi:hypothetical protein
MGYIVEGIGLLPECLWLVIPHIEGFKMDGKEMVKTCSSKSILLISIILFGNNRRDLAS